MNTLSLIISSLSCILSILIIVPYTLLYFHGEGGGAGKVGCSLKSTYTILCKLSFKHCNTNLRKFGTLDNSVKEDAWRAVVLGVEQHTETLARIFSNERLDSQDKLAHLNALQVCNTYSIVLINIAF